jgi:hypothetical protein
VPVPDAIEDRTAASVMMQGLTGSHFATDLYPVQPGEFAFVHGGGWARAAVLSQAVLALDLSSRDLRPFGNSGRRARSVKTGLWRPGNRGVRSTAMLMN